MIQVELLESENRERRYSDQGVYILQVETGNKYEDAIDIIPCPYTYEETDEIIESGEETTEEEYAKAGKILLGVEQ